MKWKRIEENENHKIEITINNQKIKKHTVIHRQN